MRSSVIFAVSFLLLALAQPLGGYLLPFLDRRESPVPDRFPDPFRVLEQIPFGLARDDLVVPPARVDWKETPNAHIIMIEVPGMKREELRVEVDENRILTVSGERKKEEEEKKGEKWHCVERVYGKFWRQFRLPENVEIDSVKAKVEDGVLTVTIAKLSPDKIKGPKVVSIEGEGQEHHKDKGNLAGITGAGEKKVEL